VSAISRLNGMFAFALFDSVTGEWLLARDHLGVKPLYYTQTKSREVAFASEIKALLTHPDVQANIDPRGLHHYLTFQFCLGSTTLFQGIRKLEPGCFLRGKVGGECETVRYWDTNFEVDEHHTEEYFLDRLRTLLDESVHLQLRSDVPVGSYLSGGLDSSVVGLLAASHLGPGVKFFHGTFKEGAAYDESTFARRAAAAASGELVCVTATAEEFVGDMPRLIEMMDEPVAGPGLFPQYRVSKTAREHVKVVLGGQGGDEIFGGYARYLIGYLEQALKGAVFETQEEGRHLVTLSSIIPNLPLLRGYEPLMQQFWREGLFAPMDERYFRLIDRGPDVNQLLAPDALATCDRSAVFADFQGVFNHPETRSYFNKMTHFDMKTLLPALLHVEDRVSMAVSLESRVPLLDARIVDLVTSMPPAMKFQAGRSKHILKRAVATLVPEAVLQRKDKMGFPVPLREWMKGGPVREFVRDILLSKRCRERGLFSAPALERLIDTEAAYGRQVWGALCLELWHLRFIDRH
jgi:asparagine synthase (glutamine-hydrolysing)